MQASVSQQGCSIVQKRCKRHRATRSLATAQLLAMVRPLQENAPRMTTVKVRCSAVHQRLQLRLRKTYSCRTHGIELAPCVLTVNSMRMTGSPCDCDLCQLHKGTGCSQGVSDLDIRVSHTADCRQPGNTRAITDHLVLCMKEPR